MASRLCDVLSGDGVRVSSLVVLHAVVLTAVGLGAAGFRAVVLRIVIHRVCRVPPRRCV